MKQRLNGGAWYADEPADSHGWQVTAGDQRVGGATAAAQKRRDLFNRQQLRQRIERHRPTFRLPTHDRPLRHAARGGLRIA
jgi:hypothetical protein